MPLPNALRKKEQWLVSGEDKAPRSVKTGAYADVRDPALYVTYDDAVSYAQKHDLDIGFALTLDDPFTVIDLDEPTTKEQQVRHARILKTFDTYAELSRSGKGVHIWGLGSVPRGVRRDKVEVYSEARYMICTGKVIDGHVKPVQDCQELLTILFNEVARAELTLAELTEEDALFSDKDIVLMGATAVNGAKFDLLCKGEWQGEYPSQSEADFALMNMFCFYSKSNEQCRRLFRYSQLGRRDKAQRDKYLDYMIGKFRAEELPKVDFSALKPKSVLNTPELVSQPIGTKQSSIAPETRISYPPGFIGEIAKYIVDSSIRPVKEVGIAAAIGMCAGILGRQYNISGTGLNQYLILLARTGVGKEGGASGVERILHATRQTIPALDTFVGPGTFASGQAIVRTLDEHPSFFSILGEFGLTLQMLSDPHAQGHTIVYRKVLMDLYTKSGWGSVLHGSAYSDQQKNTKTVSSPAFTIFGESTPDNFYAGLSQHQIADGLIPRFLIIEYTGNRPDRNPDPFTLPSENLIGRFSGLVETSLRMQANNVVQNITLDKEASSLLHKFDQQCDTHIRAGGDEATRQLWNRAHLKAIRISGLLAAASQPHTPVVNKDEAAWSIEIVDRDADRMSARFEKGDIGHGASKQVVDMKRVLHEFKSRPLSILRKYGVTDKMMDKGAVPFVYISRRVANLAAFRNDRRGGRNAVRETIQELIDSSVLVEIPRTQAQSDFNSSGKMYVITGDVG